MLEFLRYWICPHTLSLSSFASIRTKLRAFECVPCSGQYNIICASCCTEARVVIFELLFKACHIEKFMLILSNSVHRVRLWFCEISFDCSWEAWFAFLTIGSCVYWTFVGHLPSIWDFSSTLWDSISPQYPPYSRNLVHESVPFESTLIVSPLPDAG